MDILTQLGIQYASILFEWVFYIHVLFTRKRLTLPMKLAVISSTFFIYFIISTSTEYNYGEYNYKLFNSFLYINPGRFVFILGYPLFLLLTKDNNFKNNKNISEEE